MAGYAGDGCSRETQEEFIARISDKVSGGLTCIALAMGIETGLFQVMIDQGGPKTCQEIADAGKYKERYVREWLGSMAANDIVEYNAADGTYFLPPNRHCISGSVKGTAMTRAIPYLSLAFFDVAACFQTDGPRGVSNDRYGNFHELMTGMHQSFFNKRLVQVFLPSMPKIHQQLQEGIQVLDIGCSLGVSTRAIAKGFPKSQVCGIDITETGIRQAQEAAREMGLSNVQFICMSATALPADWSGKFDFVFIHNVLHDLPQPMDTLREIHRVLKVGGALSVVDTASYSKLEDNLTNVPHFARIGYILSTMNCVPTSMSAEDGIGLGAMWGREKAQEMMKEAQFEVLSVTPVQTQHSVHYQCHKV